MHFLSETKYVCIYKHSTLYYIAQHLQNLFFFCFFKNKVLKVKKFHFKKIYQLGLGKKSSYPTHEKSHNFLIGLFI